MSLFLLFSPSTNHIQQKINSLFLFMLGNKHCLFFIVFFSSLQRNQLLFLMISAGFIYLNLEVVKMSYHLLMKTP